jgi:hypothetical protein
MVLSDTTQNDPHEILIGNETANENYELTTWYKDLNFYDITTNTDGFITLSSYATGSFNTITGNTSIGSESAIFNATDDYKTLYIIPNEYGITDISNSNYITYTLKNNTYTKIELIQEIQSFFDNNAFTKGSKISVYDYGGKEYTKIRLNINKVFRSYDYNLIFYNPYNIHKCSKNSNDQITTWDTCLGWVLGYRNQTEYLLSNYYDTNTNLCSIIGDSVLSVFLYNSFILVIDDFNHNHLNNNIPTKLIGIIQNTASAQRNYGLNQQMNALTPPQNLYSPGPYIKDVFGIIPMDTSGLTNGQIYVQNANSLQQQERIYFGPVNISRLRIRLMSDRGQVISLNGSDWSIQLLCQVLYQPTN